MIREKERIKNGKQIRLKENLGMVSIIMPSFNTGAYIEKSINSVLCQTYENWELIIVDDGSSDNTDKIITNFTDARIKYVKNSTNKGAAFSRNKALRMAKGKWIAFLDSDDLWKKNKLEDQIKFMLSNNYHFSYTQYSEIDEKGNVFHGYWTGPKKITKYTMYLFNFMGCLTVMYDRQYVGLIQIIDLKKRNDYALWLKIVKKCPAYLLKENLAYYRNRKFGSLMDRRQNPLLRMKYNFIMFKKSENMNEGLALFMTFINTIFGILKKIIMKRR